MSQSVSGTSGGNGNSGAASFSSDGRWIAFSSEASDLLTNDYNGTGDIFIRDTQTGTTVLVSANQSGTGSGNGLSVAPQISADGQFVLFESAASDLVAGDTNGIPDLFIRDLRAGTTRLLSDNARTAFPGYGGVSSAMMTPDAQSAAFVSAQTTNSAGGINWGQVMLSSIGSENAIPISSLLGPDLQGYWWSGNLALSDDGAVIALKTNLGGCESQWDWTGEWDRGFSFSQRRRALCRFPEHRGQPGDQLR